MPGRHHAGVRVDLIEEEVPNTLDLSAMLSIGGGVTAFLPAVTHRFSVRRRPDGAMSTTPVQNRGLAAKIPDRVFSYGSNRLDESFSEMYTCPMLR